MRLLIILLCWFLRRRLDATERRAPDAFWRRLLRHAPAADSQHRSRVPLLVALVYVGLVTVVAVISAALWRNWGVLANGVLVLGLFAVTTGMPGWSKPLQAYAGAWRNGNISEAWKEVQHLLPAAERAQATGPEALHLLLAETLIVQTFERYFMPLFWFAVLGPAGIALATFAVGVRNHYPGVEVRRLFDRWCRTLGWVPAQLLSLTFGLAGDLAGWLRYHRSPGSRRKGYGLTAAASSALSSYALDPAAFEQHDPHAWTGFANSSLTAVRDLLNRSMWVWICFAALAAIAGLIP